MKFFNKIKDLFSDKKGDVKKDSVKPDFSLKSPQSLSEFKSRSLEIIRKSKSKVSAVLGINKLISVTDSKVLDEMICEIRKSLNDTDYVEELSSEITESLVSFRVSLLNPEYKKSKNKRLARLFMFFFSLAPDLLKEKKKIKIYEDGSFSSEMELDELMTDLSLFNLSEQEMKYTVGKIMEYNEKNVTYTNEEIIFLNNSEILREFLEKLTTDVQYFVQQCLKWDRYYDSAIIGLPMHKVKIFNSDMVQIFNGKFRNAQFLDIIVEKNINEELRKIVVKDCVQMFEQNLQTVVSYIKNYVIKENLEFIENFRKNMAWNILLLNELDELPPFGVLNSLISKSLKFHQNYYPDLMKALAPEKGKILKIIKEDYSGFKSFREYYDKEITTGMVEYVKRNNKRTVDYQTFSSDMAILAESKGKTFQTYFTSHEYFPEELSFLKRSPEAEVSIILMNDQIGKSEKGLPIFEGEYFYSDKHSFLKSVLLDTLLTLMDENVSLKTLKSLLIKSLDRSKGESSEIMEKLLASLKEDGFKRDLMDKLNKKQLKKNHITTLIKKKIAENKEWEWLVEHEDPVIKMDKFSKVTGLSFFTLKNSKGTFKVTSTFKNNVWTISNIIKAGD